MKLLVFVEHHGDTLQRDALGVLGAAAELGEAHALLAGEGVRGLAAEAAAHGATTVLVADDRPSRAPLPQPRAALLARLVEERGYDTVLLANSVLAADVAAALAARLEAGLNWDLTALRADGDDARRHAARTPGLRPRRGRLDGDAADRPRPHRQLRAAPHGGEAPVEDVAAEIPAHAQAARMLEQADAQSEGPKLEEADVIVAGGRGLGAAEGFELCERVAAALGGAVAATRAVVDAGWYPYAAQVGQTGKTVAPKLYIAAGISGAIQHKVGMQGSGTIVAVNKDRHAPIFELADLGVVGDVNEVLPRLAELLEARRNGG